MSPKLPSVHQLKSVSVVIESATNKQDAENEILKVDPDIYYMDEPEKEMIERLRANVKQNYRKKKE